MFFQNAEVYNIAEILPLAGDEGYSLSRIPESLRLRLNASAQSRAHNPASAEIRFNLNSGNARIVLRKAPSATNGRFDLPHLAEIYRGDFFESWAVIGLEWTELKVSRHPNLTQLRVAARRGKSRFDPSLVRVTLPHLSRIELQCIEGDLSAARADQTPALRYLAYGSSITHGMLAVRAEELYPARVSQAFGADLINLGFGAGAHLEPEMADYLASRTDWDFASLELGINLVRNLPVEEFRQRLDYFLTTVSQAHPDRWIFCIDLFPFDYDFLNDPRGEMYREAVRECVQRISSPRLVHLAGPDLLTSTSGLSTDLLHPGPIGFAEIGARLTAAMQQKMFPTALNQ